MFLVQNKGQSQNNIYSKNKQTQKLVQKGFMNLHFDDKIQLGFWSWQRPIIFFFQKVNKSQHSNIKFFEQIIYILQKGSECRPFPFTSTMFHLYLFKSVKLRIYFSATDIRAYCVHWVLLLNKRHFLELWKDWGVRRLNFMRSKQEIDEFFSFFMRSNNHASTLIRGWSSQRSRLATSIVEL